MTSILKCARIPRSKPTAYIAIRHATNLARTVCGATRSELQQHDHSTAHLTCSLQSHLGYAHSSPLRYLTYRCLNSAGSRGTGVPSHFPTRGRRWISSISEPESPRSHKESNGEKRWLTGTLEIPVGGNGTVSLEISTRLYSDIATGEIVSQEGDVVVHLPSGVPLGSAQLEQREGVSSDEHGGHEKILQELWLGQNNDEEHFPSISAVVTIHYRVAPRSDTSSSETDYRYPTPIHDVSVAFDWIMEHLPEFRAGTGKAETLGLDQTDIDYRLPRISIIGSHIGGSLALMLALTRPNDVYTVAVYDPVTDWVSLDELASENVPTTATSSKKRSTSDAEECRLSTVSAATTMINLRTKLFRNPSAFFDPFASPLMFLRAPGCDTHLWRTARPELEEGSGGENEVVEAMKRAGGIEVSEIETQEAMSERGYGPYDDDWHTVEQNPNPDHDPHVLGRSLEQATTDLSTLSLDGYDPNSALKNRENDHSRPQTQSSSRQTTTQLTQTTARRRKVLRRWPPTGRPEDVELPYVKIYSTSPLSSTSKPTDQDTGLASNVDLALVLHPQAKEMVDVMRRACFWGRETSHAENKVTLETMGPKQGKGEEGELTVVGRMVRWMRELDVEAERKS